MVAHNNDIAPDDCPNCSSSFRRINIAIFYCFKCNVYWWWGNDGLWPVESK